LALETLRAGLGDFNWPWRHWVLVTLAAKVAGHAFPGHGMLSYHPSPIYAFWPKSKVTGTDINFSFFIVPLNDVGLT
jgi:hypothetical protein